MGHWIVTNRRIVTENNREVVDENDHQPLPTFRIASFNPPVPNSEDEMFRKAVAFIADKNDSSYTPPKVGQKTEDPGLSGTERMFLNLYYQMLDSKGDTLFFIHGFNYSWVDSLRDLSLLHQLYVQGPESPIKHIVHFSWPSYGEITDYKSDQPIALDSGTALGRLFRKVGEFYRSAFSGQNRPPICGSKIHLGAHSMGNQVLDAFCKVVKNFDAIHLNIFGEIVLLNADADWTVIDPEESMANLNEYGDRIHVYCNHHDKALMISETFKNQEKRLGRHGPKDMAHIPARTIVVDTTSEIAEPDAEAEKNPFYSQADQILKKNGMTGITKDSVIHHWGYLFRSDVIADLKAVFAGLPSAKIAYREKKADDLYALQKAKAL